MAEKISRYVEYFSFLFLIMHENFHVSIYFLFFIVDVVEIEHFFEYYY